MDRQPRKLSRRILGVRKKASELAILCDASLCLLHFDREGQLRTLPEDLAVVDGVLKRYLRTGKPKQRCELAGAGGEAKGPADGGEAYVGGLGVERLDAVSPAELRVLRRKLDAKAREVSDRIAVLKGVPATPQGGKTCSTAAATALQARFQVDGNPFFQENLQMAVSCSGGIRVEKDGGIGKSAPRYVQFYRDGTPCLPDDLQMNPMSLPST